MLLNRDYILKHDRYIHGVCYQIRLKNGSPEKIQKEEEALSKITEMLGRKTLYEIKREFALRKIHIEDEIQPNNKVVIKGQLPDKKTLILTIDAECD